ncbi:hypothetical protein [Desulfuribacillus alkaliarsenatis]|uniref:Protein PsiE n=1 Tax=Desulfuribacillus alkaliarsenatis TaxID=766136 RepID=A0A1E5G0H6_9FIRM|nr:hypothetical protein [Desulfuribacillus alkaliarsenatis]OEF96314.1 hypothetical protein BHF68_09145 [Desulfuribacillus alkaliarsenatis]
MKEIADKYTKIAFKAIEAVIVLLLLIAIVLTGKEIALTVWYKYQNGLLIDNFKIILSEILLLAIGIEMAALIIKKNLYFVIDILILAVARKLIVYEDSVELFISIAGIMLLLLAKIYYHKKVSFKDLEREKEIERGPTIST